MFEAFKCPYFKGDVKRRAKRLRISENPRKVSSAPKVIDGCGRANVGRRDFIPQPKERLDGPRVGLFD